MLGKLFVLLSGGLIQDLLLKSFVLQRLGLDRVSVLFLYVHLTSLEQIQHKPQISSGDHMKETEHYFLVVLFYVLCKVSLSLESVDEVLKWDRSNTSY